MRNIIVSLVILLLTASFAEVNSGPKFIVAVVGDGVPSESAPPTTRAYPLNRSQGQAMWEGAHVALDSSPRLKKVGRLFEMYGYDDGGNQEDAERIARQLQRDPRILAVIGHATSATTRAAAWIYAEANIPLIMPIATSPYAMYPPQKHTDPKSRLCNVFRLPPADDRVQAPAVALVAVKKLKAKRCYLIRDVSRGAEDYSAPLDSELETLLGKYIISHKEVDRADMKFEDLAASIQAQNTDLVIFCGYGTTAQEVLHALRKTYSEIDLKERPKVLLTDGCQIKDLDTKGFYTYLTFPLPGIGYYKELSKDLDLLRSLITERGQESYEIYAYDAMLILGETALRCSESNNLNRNCLLRELNNLRNFAGVAEAYSFVEGENTLSPYYVYLADPTQQVTQPQFQLDSELSPTEIIRFRTQGAAEQ